jgi:hypothetical protein
VAQFQLGVAPPALPWHEAEDIGSKNLIDKVDESLSA